MACNSAVIYPTKQCLPPSCSSHNSASDDIDFIMQPSNMAARTCEAENDIKMSSNSVFGVIHPKVKLYI